jgi:hypothetical protein
MSLNIKFMVFSITLLILTLSVTANSQLPVNWEKCVVMIEKERSKLDGTLDTVAHGTGFIFFDSTLGGYFLVTNRHILKNRDKIFIRLNKAEFDPQKDKVSYLREPCPLIGKDSKPLWKGHPNQNIDVAAVKLLLPNKKINNTRLEYPRFKNFDNLEVGEDVYFFGFPLGVSGLKGRGDFPILRSGIVSYKSFESTWIGDIIIDSSMFLIDGFSFGGNSGSPVLTRFTPFTKTKKAMLAGIISGHIPLVDSIIVEKNLFFLQPQGDTVLIKKRPNTLTFEHNTGLAIAICADRIRETLEQFRKR